MAEHQCIDCLALEPHERPVKPRPVRPERPFRCETHRRAFVTHSRKQKRARAVERTYDISAEDNHALFLYQGGRCWLCRKATGATKSLAVDHDHQTNEVRGRLCGPCNQFIGKLGDDPEAARRLVAYLTGDTPYRRLKAQQTLLEAMYEAGDDPVFVHSVVDMGGELFANWCYGDGVDPVQWYRTLVRLVDGTWSTIRES